MIPIIVKDFTWRQTEDFIYLTVKINGIRASKSSFITANDYVRLHYPPYYFEVFLWSTVDDLKAKCTLDEEEGSVVFELPKAGSGGGGAEWPTLEVEDLTRAQKHEIRVRSVELSQKRSSEEIEKAMTRRHEQKQMTVQEQIKLDAEARERIAAIKSFESRVALSEFQEWREGVEEEEAPRVEPVNSLHDSEDGPNPQSPLDGAGDRNEPSTVSASDIESISSATTKVKISEPPVAPSVETPKLIPIRQIGYIPVKFTPREFPTPTRESTHAEEQEWLKKKAEAMKRSGFDVSDLRPEEQDPNWLLEKGRSLMNAGSYIGAVNAFSTGLKLTPKMSELYAGRAEAQLGLQNFRRAIEDSSQGLELMTPKVSSNAQERSKCHRIRAQAFLKLKMGKEALIDMVTAHSLNPCLREELESVQKAVKMMEFEDSSDDDS